MRYNARMLPELGLGMQVRLRKVHPCGGFEWKIIRLGADIGLECLTCGRKVLLTRRELAHRAKKFTQPVVSAQKPDQGEKGP